MDLNQLHLDVCFGASGGRIIWQPRILAWYSDRQFRKEPLPEPYTGMSLEQLYRALNCSNRIYEFNACFRSREDPSVCITKRQLTATEYEVLVETPVGRQTAVYRTASNTPWHMPLKYPIADEQEMKVAAWREERRTWSWDQAKYDSLLVKWRGMGSPTMYIDRVTIQKLIVAEMGAEGTMYAMTDYPAACERYFESLDVSHERCIEVINASPVRIINFGDNVHAGILSPRLFERYVLPAYQRRNELLHRAGKFTCAHWDGDCKPILQYARDTGLDGIEAITPVPQGDVTLEETKAALGDMFLLDGIPAIYFDRTFSEQTLADCVRKCIDLFSPHLVLGISDEISSTGDIERVRLVGRIVDEYNASVERSL